MSQRNRTGLLVRSASLALAVLLVSTAMVGGASARSLSFPENLPVDENHDGDEVPPNAPTMPAQEQPNSSVEVGICVVGADSPCNGDQWDGDTEDDSLGPIDSSSGEGVDATAGDAATTESPDPEFDAGLESPDPDFETRSESSDTEFEMEQMDANRSSNA